MGFRASGCTGAGYIYIYIYAEMAPQNTWFRVWGVEGFGGGISGNATSLMPNKPKISGVLVYSSACAGIHPTLLIFGPG